MASSRSNLRAILAGLLVAVLAFAGAGRGCAAAPASTGAHATRVAATAPICHVGPAAPGPSSPDRPADPDCCSACAPFAPATLPAGP